jgi:Zn-dependent protease
MILSGFDPATLIARLIVLVVSLTIHEFSHAWTATYFGDETPRRDGRLTLNPLAHLDLLGSLMILFAPIGWAKPVMVNPYALQRRSSSAMMWVSFAGPFSNLLIAIAAAIPFRLGLVSLQDAYQNSGMLPSLGLILANFILVNLSLMLFNLIPLAPLDGEKIAEYFFPPSWGRVLDAIRPYGPFILLGLVVVGPWLGIDIIGAILGPPLMALLNLLVG